MPERYGQEMQVLGISIDPAGGHPRLHGVVMGGTLDDPKVIEVFELRTNESDPSEQAVSLARLLLGKLPGLAIDYAAVRTAGTSPVPRRNRAQFSRAHAEGSVLYVLREHTKQPVLCGDPQALATAAGTKKVPFMEKVAKISEGNKEALAAGMGVLMART
jgi:hypothetical protein